MCMEICHTEPMLQWTFKIVNWEQLKRKQPWCPLVARVRIFPLRIWATDSVVWRVRQRLGTEGMVSVWAIRMFLITSCDRFMFTRSQDVYLQSRSPCALSNVENCTWDCAMLEETQSPPRPRVDMNTHRSKASLLSMLSLHEIENNECFPKTCISKILVLICIQL